MDSRRSRDPQCVSFSAASLSSCDTSRGFSCYQFFIDFAPMSDQFFTFAELLASLRICHACSSIIFQLVSPARVPVALGAWVTSCACWIAVGLATLCASLSALQLRRTANLLPIHFTDFLRDPRCESSSAEAQFLLEFRHRADHPSCSIRPKFPRNLMLLEILIRPAAAIYFSRSSTLLHPPLFLDSFCSPDHFSFKMLPLLGFSRI